MNKFLKLVFVSLLFVGSVCGVVFGVQLNQANKQIDSLYTEEEVEEKYQEYVDQISDKNVTIDNLNGQLTILTEENAQHELTISSLQSSISEKDESISTLTVQVSSLNEEIESKTSQISNLNAQIETLSEDKENNLEQIASLQSEKSALETQVSTLTATVSKKEQTIQTLTSEKAELEDEVEELTSTISGNQTTISGLNSQILTLQNEITRLEGLLESYEDIATDTFEVNFYIGETLFTTKAVRYNMFISETIEPEENNDYRFDGWSLDKETPIDLLSYNITGNTTFYALTTPKYKVDFVVDDEVTTTQYIIKGNSPTSVENPTKQYFSFLGWEYEDTLYTSLNEISVNSNMILTAQFEEDYEWVDLSSSSSIGVFYFGLNQGYFTDCFDIIQTAEIIEIKGYVSGPSYQHDFVFDGSPLHFTPEGSSYKFNIEFLDDCVYAGISPNVFATIAFTSARVYVPKA